MEATIQKWGNSLGIRIPKPLAKEVGVDENSIVEITVKDGGISIQPVRGRRTRRERRPLAYYLERITPENRHGEIQTGPAQGREEL